MGVWRNKDGDTRPEWIIVAVVTGLFLFCVFVWPVFCWSAVEWGKRWDFDWDPAAHRCKVKKTEREARGEK